MAVTINKGISASTLSLTPLIDVVFLLIIFFLVATRFEEEERSIDVNLPQASAAEPTTAPGREVFVTITPEGALFIDGEPCNANQLQQQLSQIYQQNPGRQNVTIRADAKSNTGALVAVLNACNRANITDYTIATE